MSEKKKKTKIRKTKKKERKPNKYDITIAIDATFEEIVNKGLNFNLNKK